MNESHARTRLRNLICSVPRDEISISPQLSPPHTIRRLFIFICSIWCVARAASDVEHHLLFRMHFLVAQVAAINCTECSFVLRVRARLQKHKTRVGPDDQDWCGAVVHYNASRKKGLSRCRMRGMPTQYPHLSARLMWVEGCRQCRGAEMRHPLFTTIGRRRKCLTLHHELYFYSMTWWNEVLHKFQTAAA